jgi:hypothetical protein
MDANSWLFGSVTGTVLGAIAFWQGGPFLVAALVGGALVGRVIAKLAHA